jgi:hypothetical protein
MYSRQNGIVVVASVYLFCGGIMAAVMPPMFSGIAYWMLALGTTGVIYKLFISDR